MTRKDVHQELTFIGVNSPEVHALVDDLDLTVREMPLGERLICFPKKYKPIEVKKSVYQPHTVYKEVQARLFDDECSSVRKVCRVSGEASKRIRGLKCFGSRKQW